MFFFDPLFLIMVGPAFLLALGAQILVKSTVAKWSARGTGSGMTGEQAAHAVLRHAGVSGVSVELTQGFLSDHYDPRTRSLRLSQQNFSGRSVAAVAIAAHEAGHAIQHARKYAPLQLRSMAVPVAQFGSMAFFPLFLAGLFLKAPPLLLLGVALFAGVVLLQLITLPVEFDASRRAKMVLAEGGLVRDAEEQRGVAAVLNAAALTYVAAAIQAILTLLYYAYRAGLIGGRR